ncbi:sensor histidine kinase [Streptomonospora litoralis]|nr:histidine kinase [Streptomonospora litoralis]
MAKDRTAPPAGAAASADTGTARRRPWWARWWDRRHRAADWLLAAMFFPWTPLMLVGEPQGLLVLAAGAARSVTGITGGVPAVLAVAGGTLAVTTTVCTAVLLRRSHPALLLWTAAAALVGYGDFGLAPLALFTYAAWFDERRRLAVWTLGLTVCFLAVSTADGMAPAPAISLLLMFWGLPLAVGLWIGTRRALILNLRERAERLEREQYLLADQAISAERTRIAREMHDVVAHRVSLMVLHAGGLEVSASDERTAQSAALIRNTGRDALSELREILGVLRDNPEAGVPTAPQPILADLSRLLGEWRAAGMPVEDTSAGTPAGLSAQTERTAYRIVQEALTNAAKHAPRSPVRVHLEHGPETLEITVDNAPPPTIPVDPPPGSGYGLAGLRERITLAGGTLHTGPRPDGGWRVAAVLPGARTGGAQRQGASG